MNRLPVVFLLAAATAFSQSAPRIDSISPNTAPAGSPNLTLTIDGSGFTSDTQVFWRWGTLFPSALPATVVSSNRISAIVSASLLATPGDVAIAARRSGDAAASNSVTFSVTSGFAIQTSCPLPDAVVGTIYSQTFAAQGGVAPYTWSLFSGGLPSGLGLSTAGTVSGTPTAPGQFTFGVSVRDSAGQNINTICSIRVTETPETSNLAITSVTPAGAVAGSGDTTVEIRGVGFVTGAVAVWSASPTQQSDLATTYLNPSQLTAVIPAALLAGQGSFGISVRQTNLTRQVFSNTQPFTVAGPLQMTTTCPLSDGAIDTDYSQRLVANGGFSPYQFTISAGNLPAGLRLTGDTLSGRPAEAGAYNFTLTVTDSRANTISRGCSMRVLGPLTVSPTEVNVSAPSGGLPVFVDLSLITAAPGANVTPAITTQAGGNWIRATMVPGRTPALARLTIDPAGLAPGVFRGTVTINTDGATNRFAAVPVTFTVGAAEITQLTALPAALRFAASRDFRSPAAQGILVTNTVNVPLSFTATAGASWLTVSPSNGAASASAPARLAVRATPGDLGPGTYRSEVAIVSGAFRTTVPVMLVIGASPEVLTVSKTGLTFTALQGGPSPSARQIHVPPGGNDFFWEPQLPQEANGPRWSADPPANAARPGLITQSSLTPDTSNLEAGFYPGEIRVSAPSAGNSTRFVSANVVVLPPSFVPPPEPSTGAIMLVTNAGVSPAPQRIQFRNLSRSQMAIDVQLIGDPQVFTLNTDAPRQVPPGETRPIEIGANAAALAPGLYRASLTVQGTGSATVQLIDIVLTVVSPLLCRPNRFEILPLSLPANFSVIGGLAADIEVAVRDNCGNPMPSNSGVVTVTSNTRPWSSVSLVNTGEGRWSGSWLVTQTVAGPVQLSIHAVDGNFASTQTVVGSITANPNQPVLLPDAIVSVASFAQTPVAPGGALAAFGTGLATSTTAVSPPLQVRLGGSQMFLGDRETAFYATSPTQLNVQLPFNVPLNVIEQAAVRVGTRISNRVDVATAAAQPAIFAVTGESGAIPNSANPVSAGQRVAILCEGLGAVNATLDLGFPAPSPAAETLLVPTVSIGGRQARVLSATLIPGLAGVYQVDAIVPDGAGASDDIPLIVTSAGLASNTARIAVR